jgi:large subunit ribosomal protein L21
MYGVVEVAGHQYRVSPGDIIDVNRLEQDEGSSIELDKVLFIGGENPVVGLPQVDGAKVKAKVVRQARDRKIIVFKRRPGLWRKKRGHRQHYTGLLITDIDDGKGNSTSIDQESKVAKKYLAAK